MKNRKLRSPIKEEPLRVAGQSSEKRIQDLMDEGVYPYMGMACMAIVMLFYEWARSLFSVPDSPITVTIVILFVLVFCFLRIRKTMLEVRQERQGQKGEREVAENLQVLLREGCTVLHDFPADGFNIDHVIVSPNGIFSVETKTWSKNGNETITYDGATLQAGDRNMGKKAVDQAIAQAKWLRDQLRSATGRDYPVKPVLVFPGWYVQPLKSELTEELWVLNPKALPSFVKNVSPVLEKNELHQAAWFLTRLMRLSED